MRRRVPPLILLGALALQGCAIQDRYGNSYGGFFDYGNQYAWQRTACETEIDAKNIAAELRRRYMQCCMWRNGVPIDDSTGCAAPPYYSG